MENIKLSDGDLSQGMASGQRLDVPETFGSTIWQGVMCYYDLGQPQTARLPLTCIFSSREISKKELNADKWPKHLALRFIPEYLPINSVLLPACSRNAYCINIHFSQESEALLSNKVKPGLVGCIPFNTAYGVRILFVFSQQCKHIYKGFISYSEKIFGEKMGKAKELLLHISDCHADPHQDKPPQRAQAHQTSMSQSPNTNGEAGQQQIKLKACGERYLESTRGSPYTKSKPSLSYAGPSSARGTKSATPSASQELFGPVELQASKIFNKDLVKMVTLKVLKETGERPQTVQELSDEILRYVGVKAKPSDGSTDNKMIEELSCKLLNDCVFQSFNE